MPKSIDTEKVKVIMNSLENYKEERKLTWKELSKEFSDFYSNRLSLSKRQFLRWKKTNRMSYFLSLYVLDFINGRKSTCIYYEKVKAEYNTKIMIDSKKIATSEKGVEVFQSENRNVITIIKDEYYYHIILEEIVNAVLREEEK